MEVNLLAVVVAGVLGMAIGAAWYSPMLFGKRWMKESGMTDEDMARAKAKGMGKSYALGLVSALVMAYILAMFVHMDGARDVAGGAALAFWLWLGFVATVMLSSVLWENKSWTLYAINAGYYLVSLLVMATVLVLWV